MLSRKQWFLVLASLVAALTIAPLALAAANTTAAAWALYQVTLGEPVIRSKCALTAGTAKDNTTCNTAYTFTGNEHVCIQGDADFYVQVVAAASYTASGADSIRVPQYVERCFWLKPSTTKVSVDAVTGTANIKMFETVYP